jgi:hypothetical protein
MSLATGELPKDIARLARLRFGLPGRVEGGATHSAGETMLQSLQPSSMKGQDYTADRYKFGSMS